MDSLLGARVAAQAAVEEPGVSIWAAAGRMPGPEGLRILHTCKSLSRIAFEIAVA